MRGETMQTRHFNRRSDRYPQRNAAQGALWAPEIESFVMSSEAPPGRLDKLSTGTKPACATVEHRRGPMLKPDEQHSVELLDERRPLQPNRLPMLTPVLFHPVSEAEQHLGIIEEFCLDIGGRCFPKRDRPWQPAPSTPLRRRTARRSGSVRFLLPG